MKIKKSGCYKIQLLTTDSCEFYELDKMKPIFQISCDAHNLIQEPVSIVADPFLFVKNNTLFLFYEHKKLFHDAVIMMTCTRDLSAWSEPIEVLSEPFHLSYPWVFEYGGRTYMIPETCNDKSIRIYEAEDEGLTKWKFVKKLLEQDEGENVQIGYSDSSVVERDKVFYLYTTIKREGINELLLFCAKNLMGPYREHPCSPLIRSQKYGRNGGSFIEDKGVLYRVAQDCVKRYGDNLHLMRVLEMTPENYKEEVVKENVIDTSLPIFSGGGHQLNFTEFHGKKVVATDTHEYHYFLLQRILHKLWGHFRK